MGLTHTGAAAALLLAPEWFYATFGEFPPFNRHYAGDAGAFLLPIGLGLLVAARDPKRFRAIVVLGLGASWLHALNHGYDALVHSGQGRASLLDAATIVGVAIALSLGAWLCLRTPRGTG